MQLNQDQLVHINSIAHAGKVIVVATFSDGSLQYTVRQDGFEQSYLAQKPEQRIGWEKWKVLPLPDDAVGDPSVTEREAATLRRVDPAAGTPDGDSDRLLRSVYQSTQLGAVVPVQLVSTSEYLYVFRQSNRGTLLVDRFIFDGLSNELKPKLEVRYRRSRQKYNPQSPAKRGGGGLQTFDSLDFTDMSGAYFYEPTTELSLIHDVQDGRFAVVQVPTSEHDKFRWHFFFQRYDAASSRGLLEHLSLRTSEEGLFDLRDYTFMAGAASTPHVVPGILWRTIDVGGQSVVNGPAAALYDVQREAYNSQTAETYLLRAETRLMLSIPTESLVTTLSFAVADDGTLSQLPGMLDHRQTLRGEEQTVLLPLDTLDSVVACAQATPPPECTITGMAQGAIDSDASGQVVVSSPQAALLSDGDEVRISGTMTYDGLYPVSAISGSTFVIRAPYSGSALGSWQKQPSPNDALLLDGRVTSYQLAPDGGLILDAANHQLQDGDSVQLVGSVSYDGVYPITKLDDGHFAISTPFLPSAARNLRLLASRRRGIVLDGVGDYIELPNACLPTGAEITISFWARGGQSLPNPSCVFYAASGDQERSVLIHLPWSDGVIYFDCGVGDRIGKPAPAADFRGKWTHWAFSKNVSTGEMQIFCNGVLWCSEGNRRAPICATGSKVNFVAAGRIQPGPGRDNHWEGSLSDLQIWSRALTAPEVQTLMYSSPAPGEPDLLGHWPLGAIIEGATRTVLDFSAHAHDGIVRYDGPASPAAGAYVSAVSLPRNLAPDPGPGPLGITALGFDGRDDYVSLPAMNIDWSQGVTVEAWVRYEAFNQYTRVVDFSNGAEQNNIILAHHSTNPNLMGQTYSSGGHPWLVKDGVLPTGVWTHVAMSVGPGNVGRLYKNGQLVLTGTLMLPDNVQRVQNWIGRSAFGSDGYFQGQMCELRVWKLERGEADILRDCDRRISGAEPGLVGYWPMNEGSGGLIYDRVKRSSGSPLDGTIVGAGWRAMDVYFGAPPPPPPPPQWVVTYKNDEMFPVAQNATYREEFEFRLDAPLPYHPRNVIGGYPIFQFVYWGRGSRADTGAPITISSPPPSFTALGGGWWRASCVVTIPPGMGFLRLFQIGSFTWPAGAQPNLEVRKHRFTLIAASISEERRIETLTAASPAPTGSAQQRLIALQESQNIITALEQREGRLAIEQAACELRKARILDIATLSIDTAALKSKVEDLAQQAQALLDVYNAALANPLNYYCRVQVQVGPSDWRFIHAEPYKRLTAQSAMGPRVRFPALPKTYGGGYKMAFEVSPGGDPLDFRSAISQTGESGTQAQLVIQTMVLGVNEFTGSVLRCEPVPDGSGGTAFRILKLAEDPSLYAYMEVATDPADGTKFIRRQRGCSGSLFRIIPTDDHQTYGSAISDAQLAWETKKAEYESWAGLRDSATGSVAACDSRLQAIASSLAAVRLQLALAQSGSTVQDLVSLNSDSGAAYFAMESLAPDARGLVTQRASLPFISPSNRMTATQTCEGYVQLTYVDGAGRMRQAVYHAVADSQAGVAFEKWYPEPPRGCALLDRDRSVITPNQPLVLAAEWTLEAWFYYPLPTRDWNVIATSSDGQNSQLLIRKGKYLGCRIGGMFYACGHSFDGLCPGWHHVAVVKRGSTAGGSLAFYIDGDPVGRPITAVGSVLSLHGGSDKVTLSKDSLPTGEALTFCVFARGNATNAGPAYLLRAKNAAGTDVLCAQLQHGELKDQVVFTCGSDTLRIDFERPLDDEWTHWAFSKNLKVAGGVMAIYRNGQQIAVAASRAAALPTAVTALSLGDGFSGSLFEPSLWSKTMWAGDLATWLGQIAVGTEDKLCGVWRFDEKAATDRSSKAKHGTYEGTPTAQPRSFDGSKQIDALGNVPPVAATTVTSSVHPNAITLNGTNQRVELAPASWPVGSELTVCFYSKGGAALPCGSSVLSAYGPNVGRMFNIHLPWSDGILYFDCAGDRLSQAVPASLYKGAWTHWAFTKNVTSGEMRVYCNGELFGSASGKRGQMSAASIFLVGALQDSSISCYYPGQVSELQVWSRVLSQDEIRQYKDTCPLGSEPGLAAYYSFEAASARDKTPNQRSGQYVGGPTVAVETALTVNVRTLADALPGQQCGKLAEVRLWNCALSSDEINANSVTLPTGREPGLQAYYSLRTLPGGTAWGQTELDPDAVMTDGSYSACSPPIGNPGNAALFLDGIDAHVTLPALTLDATNGLTVEVWVLCDTFTPQARILDFGNGPTADNILLYQGSTAGSVRFEVLRGSTAQSIEVGGVLELGRWIHIAVTINTSNEAILYKNAARLSSTYVQLPSALRRTQNYLGGDSRNLSRCFDGQLAEVRIWNKARQKDELRENLHRSLLGKEEGLVGYWPLDTLLPGSMTRVRDHSAAAAHGTLQNAARVLLTNALPVGVDAVVSAEYTTLGYDPQDSQKKLSMMRRFFGGRVLGAALLLPDKRVEAVELKWVGNGQFAPTLLGFIEGAPPVPSENLTEAQDYSGATSVELSVSDSVDYSWSRSQSTAMGGSLDMFLGIDMQTMGGLGVMEQLMSVKAGAKGSRTTRDEQNASTNITSSSSQTVADRLELRGTQEKSPAFAELGRRFVPRNVGYALVISSLADVYISRLRRSGRMVGYTILPVDCIPPDVNTITFLMNPAYVQQGSLDGMIGSSAASSRFYRNVPDMRTQYGALYPASYYRLQEAYALKEKIEAADKRRAAYFAQFEIPASVATEGEDLATPSPTASSIGAVLGQIKNMGQELSQQLHAQSAFLSWQKKMADMQVQAGKRNIVNTYVWDADGGLHADQQSFANTIEHTIGGSFSLDASFGFQSDVSAFGAAVDLTALSNFSLTQSISKTESHTTAVQLNVDLSGVESTGITDENARPILPGEKVDRYRFMTFYLEGSTDNYNEFFQKVVDPEWLLGNSEEARALRQAKGKANKAWRILHRVTCVERPVLAGLGRAVPPPPQAEEEDENATGEILRYFDLLSVRHKQVLRRLDQNDTRYQALADKLDQILRKLNA